VSEVKGVQMTRPAFANLYFGNQTLNFMCGVATSTPKPICRHVAYRSLDCIVRS